jgi:mono/diheme cytochrome c family protein
LSANPNYLFVEIIKMLDPAAFAGTPVKSIAGAPLLELPEDLGEMIFMELCATCHTMGMGAGNRVGPDLKGVTTRWAPAWLFNYIAAPDHMRASKDPLALELARHSTVPMPNLRLTTGEVTNVIGYLEAQDAQTSALKRKKRKSPPAKP